MLQRLSPEDYLHSAIEALTSGSDWRSTLDAIPAPVYTTDAEGGVTYWNKASVEFAGREPQLGQDRWCVTWHLFTTDGQPLDKDQCPMAQALKQRRPVRDAVAVAERPDGRRIAFRPYPTPLFDDDGTLIGAVNLLVDVTEEQTYALREQALRCRRLADATYDRETARTLARMADGFDRTANDLAAEPR